MAQGSGRRPLVADKRYPKGGSRKGGGSTRRASAKAKKSATGGLLARLFGGGKKAPSQKRAAPRKPKPAPRRSGRATRGVLGIVLAPFRWAFRLVWGFAWRVGLVCTGIVVLAVGYQYAKLPEVAELLDGRARGSVTLLDEKGEVFAWRGDQFGGVVTTETVSKHLKNAVVATEDKRFYRHFGISPRGIASAVRINLSEGRGPLSGHGGSTITQQTAKLLCLGQVYDPDVWESERAYEADCRKGSLWRKATEAVYAMAMEAKYSKDEILSIYMNRAYMGGGAYGAEAAAQRYFGKSANQLSAAEGAMIAGLLTAPSSLAPTNNLKRSQDRAATVLRLMHEQGYLTAEETSLGQSNPAELSEAAEARAGGYFADWVMDTVPSYFGDQTSEDVVIRTTLDQRLQTAVEEAMKHVFSTKVREGSKAQAAIVVMSADGAVRAMVGGRKTRVSGVFNRATQAKRQTGSAFKPFVYATALELGYSPLDKVLDAPYCLDIPGSGEWCPQNYTRKYYGEITLTQALRDSLNVPAVKISEAVGRDLVRRVAGDFGIDNEMAEGPALALGASESTLLEMTGAYAGILNGGSSVTPYGLTSLSLVGDSEPLMGSSGGMGERVIRPEAARQLVWMMEKVIAEGTGQRAQIPGWQAAGKSGTTQAARDAWFIGFTADYVAGVWMGYDDNTPLTGVTGGGLPAEIWHEAMVRVHAGLEPKPLPLQEPVPVAMPQQPTSERGNRPRLGQELGRAVDGILRDIFGN
ncbi:PBP1A family penicillin-binding protein [Phaeobacter sp. QD34_3]|uniref:transglycosylase domain-containing protein n=1 Tax=unclassified Phaeobacter TaxID=2621772 RepID=UPI00237F8171|nr:MULTISPECIES: PBP1A family penicillin-binding protein [unclassified Phaeobacter]MDE4133062.1 PBP1A family penicillin-binding protein [Phaeobacter sp. QD34_3]MDE4136536.1 PBP1A family penicillin-binding protein [Phaeobacter sp. QD34_24]